MKRIQLNHRDRVEEKYQMKDASRAAFTRIELAATLAALAILCALAAPMLATTRSDAERAGCMNNLRRIGGGVRLWASDYQERVSWRTPRSDGGTLPDSGNKPGAAWYEFSFLSNELVSPNILSCPADPQALVAPTWDSFFKSNIFRSSALSYCVGLEVLPDFPRSIVASDRNIKFDAYGATTCSARVTDAGMIAIDTISSDTTVRWTNAVHGNIGHVLLNDGSVVLTDSDSYRKLLGEQPGDYQQTIHILRAR